MDTTSVIIPGGTIMNEYLVICFMAFLLGYLGGVALKAIK